jgi:hypothetical protein
MEKKWRTMQWSKIGTAIAGAGLGLVSTFAGTSPVVFTLDPPPANVLPVTLTVTAGADTRTDTQPSTMSGSPEADLTLTFTPVDVTGLEFTGGRLALSDMTFDLDYGFSGNLIAESSNISGFLDTSLPPGPVVDGLFPLDQHSYTIDQGTFNVVPSGLISLFIDPMFVDLSTDPTVSTISTIGQLGFSQDSVAGSIASYSATFSFPFAFTNVVLSNSTSIAELIIDGSISGAGPASVILPPPKVISAAGLESTGFEFVAGVESGATYVVDYTENFSNWIPDATGTATSVSYLYSDPAAAASGKGYRIRFE